MVTFCRFVRMNSKQRRDLAAMSFAIYIKPFSTYPKALLPLPISTVASEAAVRPIADVRRPVRPTTQLLFRYRNARNRTFLAASPLFWGQCSFEASAPAQQRTANCAFPNKRDLLLCRLQIPGIRPVSLKQFGARKGTGGQRLHDL
jgi:hypothetical protein